MIDLFLFFVRLKKILFFWKSSQTGQNKFEKISYFLITILTANVSAEKSHYKLSFSVFKRRKTRNSVRALILKGLIVIATVSIIYLTRKSFQIIRSNNNLEVHSRAGTRRYNNVVWTLLQRQNLKTAPVWVTQLFLSKRFGKVECDPSTFSNLTQSNEYHSEKQQYTEHRIRSFW